MDRDDVTQVEEEVIGAVATSGAAQGTTGGAPPSEYEYRGRAPGPYRPGSNWETWRRLFTNFLEIRRVKEEKDRRLIFLQEIGEANYELLRSLLQGREPEATDLDELMKAMEKHYQPKKLVWSERYKLNKMEQRPGQSLADFYAEIQKQANFCIYDQVTDMRDTQVLLVFLGGICSIDTRKKLLEVEKMTSREALEKAEGCESVMRNAPHLKEGIMESIIGGVQVRGPQGQVGRPMNRGPGPTKHQSGGRSGWKQGQMGMQPRSQHHHGGAGPTKQECFCCGRAGHFASNCLVKGLKCRKCGRTGHLEKMCKQNGQRRPTGPGGPRQINECDEDGYADEDRVWSVLCCPKSEERRGKTYVKEYRPDRFRHCKPKTHGSGSGMEDPRTRSTHGSGSGMENPSTRSTHGSGSESRIENRRGTMSGEERNAPVDRVSEPPCLVRLKIHGESVDCELDTGASISILCGSDWQRMGKPTLVPAQVKAKAYNNSQLKFKGSFLAVVELNGKKTEIMIPVLDDAHRSLLGRDLIRALEVDCGPYYRVAEVGPVSRNRVEQEVQELLEENKELFGKEIGTCRTTKAALKFKSEPEAKFFRCRSVPFATRPKVIEKLEEMERNGVLEKVEHSDWATPLVVVPKPGGKVRVCGDYKVTVNPQLDINQYPFPKPEEIFQMLNGGKKFSKMDLADAYMQVELEECDRKYTTVNTPKGLYRYTRIPFGISSAPAIFQRIMETTLAGIEGVLVYLDDITVTAPDDEEHVRRLRKVLERLRNAGFRLKKEKCEFLKEEIELLGHLVNAQGVKPCANKIKAMVEMPDPKNVKEIESFLGMVQYYAKFVPNLSTLAAPLNDLRKKDVKWVWGQEQIKACREIREKLASADNLTHYNPDIPVILATDASEYGLGAVIYHKYADGNEKVIAYASRSLTKCEKNYGQIEKEGLGIVYGIEKFNQYLYGRKFTLLTDHQPLVRIFGPKIGIPVIAAKRLHRWALRLIAYSFDIEYRRTEEFGNADGLSRLPDPRELPSGEVIVQELEIEELNEEVYQGIAWSKEGIDMEIRKDAKLSQVWKFVQTRWPAQTSKELREFEEKREELYIHKGCLMWQCKLVVPEGLRKEVIKMLHSGHYGKNRMLALARQKMWYPGMTTDIEKVARSCSICAKFQNEPYRTPLHPWEEPEKPWQRLHMDFCESKGGDKWLIIVDAKSKWPEVCHMTSTTTEK